MKTSRLFGDRPSAAVSLVEPSASRWYAHRARVAFVATFVAVGALSATVTSQVVHTSSNVMTAVVAVGLGAIIGSTVGLVAALVIRAWPVLRALWWWALEITLAGGLLVSWWLLSRVSPWLWPTVLAALAVGLGIPRRVRTRLVAWTWCVVVRHRLRDCFAKFIRATSRQGSRPIMLPFILLARPTPAGERVWLWLRPGLALADLETATGKMAVACGASEVRVQRASASYAALIRVDISRRDPLVGVVVSPLAGRFRELETARTAPALPQSMLSGLDLDGVPEIPDPHPRDPRDRRN